MATVWRRMRPETPSIAGVSLARAAGHAGVGRLGIADGAGVVNFLAADADLVGRRDIVPVWNNYRFTDRRDLSPVLNRVIFVSEARRPGLRATSYCLPVKSWRFSASILAATASSNSEKLPR